MDAARCSGGSFFPGVGGEGQDEESPQGHSGEVGEGGEKVKPLVARKSQAFLNRRGAAPGPRRQMGHRSWWR
jgi:hypothetical protein